MSCRYSAFVAMRTGRSPDPVAWGDSYAGFEGYITSLQLQHFAPIEFVQPRHPGKVYPEEPGVRAHGDKGYIFLPEQKFWPRAAALGIIADEIRHMVKEPVHIANWYRPPHYNKAVGGAEGSRHCTAAAVDLDLQSLFACNMADTLLDRMRNMGWFELGVGIGRRRRHVDMFARKKQATWQYGG